MRSSAKFFSILLALALVLSLVPAVDARAEEAIGAPTGLAWGPDGTVRWSAPEELPDSSVYTKLSYKVKLYNITNQNEPAGEAQYDHSEEFKDYDISDFAGIVAEGGTFYFTVQLVAQSSGVDAATLESEEVKSAEKTFESGKRLATPDWKNKEICVYDLLSLDMTTLDEIAKTCVLFNGTGVKNVGKVEVEVYKSDAEITENRIGTIGRSVYIFSIEEAGTAFLMKRDNEDPEVKYFAIRYRYLPETEANTASDWSELKSYDDPSIQRYTIELEAPSAEGIAQENDGTIKFDMSDVVPPDGFSDMFLALVLYKKDGDGEAAEYTMVSQGSILLWQDGEKNDQELTSDVYKNGFSGAGEYVLVLQFVALSRGEDGTGERISSHFAKVTIDVTDSTVKPLATPEMKSRKLTKNSYGEWDQIIEWTDAAQYEDSVFGGFAYELQEQYLDMWGTFANSDNWPDNSLWLDYEDEIARPGGIRVRVKALSNDISKAVASDWLEIELEDIPIQLTANLFDVDTRDEKYDGTQKVKTVEDKTGRGITEGTDYEVTYANNTQIGTATLTVTGKGDKYKGSVTYSFEINSEGDSGNDPLTRAKLAELFAGNFFDGVYSDSAERFTDLEGLSDAQKNAIGVMVDRGIMSGAGSDGEFNPDGTLTRAELAMIAWRSYDSPRYDGANYFADVEGSWYADAVNYLYTLGVIQRDEDGNFNPDETATENMLVDLMANYADPSDPGVFIITYDANGGTVELPGAVTDRNGCLTSLSTPTRTGYTFDGWYTAKDGGDKVTTGTVFTEDTTIYAHWKSGGSTGGTTGGGGGGGSFGGGAGSASTGTQTTVTNSDGSTTTTVTKADGSKTETTTTKDGVVGKTETNAKGEVTSAEVTIPAGSEGVVTAPVEVKASADSESAPEISVKTPAGGAKVEIPVTNADAGTVAVIVHADGTEEVIRDCVEGENGVVFSTDGDVTIKIVDRGGSFNDMTGSAWAADAVKFVSARELFNGTGENTFSPAVETTRGMLATVLHRLAYEPELGDSAFPDVDAGKYYTDAVKWAAEEEIVTGYTDGTFGPDDTVTREQMVTMLYRFAAKKGAKAPEENRLTAFPDSSDVNAYALEAMNWAVSEGIINGVGGGKLSPATSATRAEMAAVMMRLCDYLAK